MATATKTKKAPVAKAATAAPVQRRADIKGWVLCPGDNVLIVSPGEEYHGLFGKVDAFPTILELSSYVQIDGRPSTTGRVLLPNAQLRWMGPDEAHIDQHRPTRPGQQVRVVLDNEALATPELKAMEGKLGTVTELSGSTMMTVKFEDPELAPWPTNINSFDLLVVPIPVVHYVPEPEVVAEHPAIQEDSDLPFLDDSAKPEVAVSMEAWELLEQIAQHLEYNVSNDEGHGKQLNELQAAGLIELMPYANGTTVRATAAGIAAANDDAPLPRTPHDDMRDAHKAGLRLVPLASIVVTTNTRKVFDEAALAELAESVRAHGILQPIVLRPHPIEEHRYELVAGGRRYRAAQLAELVEVPATVRTLTDRGFLEVQLLENLQRVDVRPADEAQAFSKLLKNDFSAEEVALKVGKPVKFVLQRAKLVALIPFWMELLEADRLPLVAAHELARLPMHSQVVVKKWFEGSHTWELKQAKPLEASTIRHGINQEVMRQLAGAAFPKDDALLYREAGPCTTCPKNSANCRGLFDEAGHTPEAGKCLDAACFTEKKTIFLNRRKKELAGTDVPLISTSYASPPAGALGYKFYDRAKEGDKGAVPALMVDGADAGAINWVKLSKGAPDAQAVVQDNKAEKAAAIRANRIKKMTNELLAEKLRETFTAELLDPSAGTGAAHALLDHWLKRSLTFGKTRTPNDMLSHLVGCYGWQEPTEAELVSTWSDKGDSPHYVYLNRQLAAMADVLDKVALFFDLKIRDGLEQTEYTGTQATLVKALPNSYQPAFNVAEQAENRVQVRYYSKGKKQEATA